eukprot:TRINITY_DN37649_c0_g1_i1.p1 TRINITY_DN37649_c0_g1~~TRINITY_DN37649_c0_g1_i1.p1  ORF type:complete len:123 (-),score=25.88 TRINITY_DN37649_c0_g1_i1:118-486(-)
MEAETRRTLDRSKTEDVEIEIGDEEAAEMLLKISTIFNKYDTNGDGVLSKDELKEVICGLNPPAGAPVPTLEQLDAIMDVFMKEIDTNCNGKIEMKEFVKWMYNKPARPKSAGSAAFPSRIA